MAQLILLKRDEQTGVAEVRLNRPEASNALDIDLLERLREALAECHDARAVLLSGEGRNFCAGGDIKAFARQSERLADYIREATARLNEVVVAMIELGAPVVAAVQGWATGGGGVGLVCASDIVIAAASARFMLGATRVGMAPDAGASVTLARHVGLHRALDLALTNRCIDAEEARRIGLVARVVADESLHEKALGIARELAVGSPAAQAATKRLIWDGIAAGVRERLAEEARAVTELSGTPEALARLRAVIERTRGREHR